MITVKAIEDWGWWYKVGSIYIVRPFPYRATRNGTLDYCDCVECVVKRLGEQFFSMYEVAKGNYKGSIIPVVACEITDL